jgi:ribulose-5-phosphate 4-epimerase/fuculose-1-phosphate aldolase
MATASQFAMVRQRSILIIVYNKCAQTEDPLELIPSLLRQFYTLGWVTGTGGGISVRKGDRIFIAPSGVQKERVVVHIHI